MLHYAEGHNQVGRICARAGEVSKDSPPSGLGARAAIIFTRVRAPPPPFTDQPPELIESAPSIATPNRANSKGSTTSPLPCPSRSHNQAHWRDRAGGKPPLVGRQPSPGFESQPARVDAVVAKTRAVMLADATDL